MVASKSALVAFIFTAMPSELDHLAGIGPDDMAADHAVVAAVDHELHEGAACRGRRASPSSGGTIVL